MSNMAVVFILFLQHMVYAELGETPTSHRLMVLVLDIKALVHT